MATIKVLVNGEYVDMPYYAAHWYAGEAGLNLAVVGGSQPVNPVENTVWVDTSTDITDWSFTAVQPTERADGTPLGGGEVWFVTSDTAKVRFNVLKSHNITVSPNACKQYIGGEWVDKNAAIYQNGVWVDWRTFLYNNGNEYTDISGGWVTKALGSNSTNYAARALTVTKGATSITATQPAADSCGILYAANKIDLTDFSVLHAVCSMPTSGLGGLVALHIWSNLGSYVSTYEVAKAYPPTELGEITIDVSELTGEHYIGFHVFNNVNSINLQSMWFT